MASLFTKSSDLPIHIEQYNIPRPSYHPQNKHSIILTTDFEETSTKPGIYEYNIEANESTLLYIYDQNMRPEAHGQFIDPSNNSLIIFGGEYFTFHTFDLNTNTMQQTIAENMADHMLSKCKTISNPTHIPSPINQIHFFDGNKHCIFDIQTKSVTLNNVESFDIQFENPELMYVPSKNKLFIFGSYYDEYIYECDTSIENQCVWNWKKSKIKMPHSSAYFYCKQLLGFENILFVFYFSEEQNNEIHLLDLLNDKWYKSQYCVPKAVSNREPNLVMKYNDSAHILNFETKQHFKVCLHDLIPKELVVSHRKYYKGLITGYVREKESQLSIQRVPFVLKHLILLYYQIFS